MTARYPGFEFDSDEDFDIDAADFDDFEFMCKIVPKKNPNTGQYNGSMCHHETIMTVPDPRKKKKLGKAQKEAQAATDAEIDGLSFEDEKLMHDAPG